MSQRPPDAPRALVCPTWGCDSWGLRGHSMPFWLHETPIHLLVRDRTLPLPSLPRLPGLQLRHSWASSLGPAAPSCPPRQHLVFLKTHKSGSSSVLSLLHRYGDRHGLRFALPARYQFGYPRLFQASRVKGYRPQSGGTQPPFHILCHHMRFNLKEVRSVKRWEGLGRNGLGPVAKTTRGGDPRHLLTQKLGWGGAHKGGSPVLFSLAVPSSEFSST